MTSTLIQQTKTHYIVITNQDQALWSPGLKVLASISYQYYINNNNNRKYRPCKLYDVVLKYNQDICLGK